jgi:uncharacterized repeat protein (TIGR01451 family)
LKKYQKICSKNMMKIPPKMPTKLSKNISFLGLSLVSCFSFCTSVLAEGSYQIGTPYQALAEYNSQYNNVAATGLTQIKRPIYVDIATAGEVINISACGLNFTDDWSVEIYYVGADMNDFSGTRATYPPPSGTLVHTSTTRTQGSFGTATNNANCNTFAQLTTIANTGNGATAKYTTTQAGVYEIRLNNVTQNGTAQLGGFRQFDVSITPNTTTLPNPTTNQGRLWSFIWGFDADDFTSAQATDANLYIRVPGGFPGTNYVWQLDLNDFAGNVYELVANNKGVNSPNAVNNQVSGLSVPFTDNNVNPQYRQYISYPALTQPEPIVTNVVTIDNFRFEDINGQDNTISPGSTTGVQDNGVFKFNTNINGTYAIIIDVDNDGNASNGYNPDGIFGTGDISLRGTTNSSGETTVPWDGKTNLGATLPEGTYRAQLQAIVGEYHFVAGDVENSGPTTTGLFIKRAVSQAGVNDVNNYWDDITGIGAANGGTSSLPDGFIGGNGHRWGTTGSGDNFGDNTNAFGNLRYLDTYVYGKFNLATTPAIIIDSTTDSNDYGDAPDTYGTNKSITVGGVPASHIPSTTLRLGNTATDAETDGIPSTDANGDDTNNATDDENGITAFSTLTSASTTYSVSVNYLKNISGNAYLVGWIDFNRNGVFEATEGVSQTLPSTASATETTTTLTWSGLNALGLTPGTTYARFRINKDPLTASSPTGGGTYGEVEDYQLTIIPNIDYGDAPDTAAGTSTGNYKTTLSDGGARHNIVTSLRLGSEIDADNGTLQNTSANNDDSDGTADDEDSVTNLPSLTTTIGQNYTVPVSTINTTGVPAFLVGYIDFNRDGDFEDAGEKSTTVTIANNATSANISFTSPSAISAGNTYMRLRLGSTQSQVESSFGLANNGEVEDYQLTINTVIPAELKLLKRITNVSRGGVSIVPSSSQPLNAFNEDGIANNDDNNVKWPDSNSSTGNNSDTTNLYLRGAINGGQVIKNDIIEYTIYFLNTGGLDAQNLKLCDRIPANTTFVPDAFGTGQGISLAFSSSSLPTVPNLIYTNDRTDTDGGKYFPAGVEPTGCKRETAPGSEVFVPITAADNTTGTVMVEIPTLPDTTGQNPFVPNNAYGFIRFRATVNPQ